MCRLIGILWGCDHYWLSYELCFERCKTNPAAGAGPRDCEHTIARDKNPTLDRGSLRDRYNIIRTSACCSPNCCHAHMTSIPAGMSVTKTSETFMNRANKHLKFCMPLFSNGLWMNIPMRLDSPIVDQITLLDELEPREVIPPFALPDWLEPGVKENAMPVYNTFSPNYQEYRSRVAERGGIFQDYQSAMEKWAVFREFLPKTHRGEFRVLSETGPKGILLETKGRRLHRTDLDTLRGKPFELLEEIETRIAHYATRINNLPALPPDGPDGLLIFPLFNKWTNADGIFRDREDTFDKLVAELNELNSVLPVIDAIKGFNSNPIKNVLTRLKKDLDAKFKQCTAWHEGIMRTFGLERDRRGRIQ